MDFFKIKSREVESGPRKGEVELYPDFTVGRSKDLMVRGNAFYAIWDEQKGLWSTDEYDVQRLVDSELHNYAEYQREHTGIVYNVKYLQSFSNKGWVQFRQFCKNVSDSNVQLDENLTFANTEVKKSDHVSRRLPYSLEPGDYSAWDELVGTLYSVEERAKIEWAIGAVVSGDAKKIQKFLVLYGPAGTGKSTILNIILKLFEGYTTTFDAKALGSSGNGFATDVFKDNPLVAVQQDGDLSKIEDNTKLNSIISHEYMPMNEKYKAGYTAKVNAFLFMGTNQPVKISDAKSGIIRRLIDVHPTGVIIPTNHYHTLMSRIDFELGAIAYHCLKVYQKMGRNYYSGYRPLEMMLQTDVFFNFIEANFDVFKQQDYTTLKQAYALYKEYCSDTGIERPLPQYKVREELRNYFDEFKERVSVDNQVLRSYYGGFNANKFKEPAKEANVFSLVIEETTSIFDELASDWPAQGAKEDETPRQPWSRVKTTLREIETSELHYVRVPENHIVIDFDLKDEDGEKSLERNLEAASVWPATYAELSKGGSGVHLHYIYDGDVSQLSAVYSDGIEVKTLLGNSSLRRRLTKCNNIPVATISSGLPIKEKKVLSEKVIKSEKGLRDLIGRHMRKEIMPGTKPSIDMISMILQESYDSGLPYDLSDLKPSLIYFANGSSNQNLYCLKKVQQMQLVGKNAENLFGEDPVPSSEIKDDRIVFFDVEVFPNLFVVCWKFAGDANVVKMINPAPHEVEDLFKFKLVGFNCRRYDNHILYARHMGYSNEGLYDLSQKIINNRSGSLFGAGYDISYADIYDFSSEKKTLKKFEIELGIKHLELGLPWDQPVPDDMLEKVVEYCANDVIATEAVFEARKADFTARQILAELSGLSINDTTQKHTARIIFGDDRRPQEVFNKPDLSLEFPGYEFNTGKSKYHINGVTEEPGEGGYVYAEPGLHSNVTVLDVASMHPTSIEVMNLFGPYTAKFSDLKSARIAIKHGDYDAAGQMLDGRLKPYLDDKGAAKDLSYALKIVINTVYGLTSARFENPFRDPRNIDNVVAKRGALFMINLKHEVQAQGFKAVHIKTDSIKIPDASPEIVDFVMKYGEKYGYTFEDEGIYDRFGLVNDAVYIAKKAEALGGGWEAVGKQFQRPYVFKTMFSKEPIEFDDLCETRSVIKGAMYLDFEYDRPMPLVEGMQFVGKTGLFVPVEEGYGGVLYRIQDVDGTNKVYSVGETKGTFWMEAHLAKELYDKGELKVDWGYFHRLADGALEALEKVENFTGAPIEDFLS